MARNFDDSLPIAFRWIGATLLSAPIGFYFAALLFTIASMFEPGMLGAGSDPLSAIAFAPLAALFLSPLFMAIVFPATLAYAIASEFAHQR